MRFSLSEAKRVIKLTTSVNYYIYPPLFWQLNKT